MWQGNKWVERKKNVGKSIGRIPTISLCAKQIELYSLRVLLHNIPGATSFDELKTVEGVVMKSFHEACQKLGLMNDDSEFQKTFEEAVSVRFGEDLIQFFSSLLEFCRPGNPAQLYEKFKEELSYHYIRYDKYDLVQAENCVLMKMKAQLSQSGHGMEDFDLPEPAEEHDPTPRVILCETNYDCNKLLHEALQKVDLMNNEQTDFFNKVIQSVSKGDGQLFCLNAAGGTGKTFSLNTLLDAVRGDGLIALATATSGVASRLLHNGTTLHSRFKVPINIKPNSMCRIKATEALGRLVKMTRLIIIDEMTMMHKHVYEAVDRTVREITGKDKVFGGITTVFAGDWRQCLPVVPRGSPGDIVNACLKSSYLWKNVKVINFTRNMRVELRGDSAEFSQMLLAIGNGDLVHNEEMGNDMVRLPEDLFTESDKPHELIETVFPELQGNYQNANWLKDRAILCPTNEECDVINTLIINKLPGNEVTYKSCDSVGDDKTHEYPI